MGFNDFRFKILLRVVLLAVNLFFTVLFIQQEDFMVLGVVLGIIALIQTFEIYAFVSQTNKKLTQFLESIKYSDFITGFSSGNKLGGGFKELNASFNDIIEAFRQARSEKEENWQYLNIVVEHVSVGVISFDQEGNVGLMNATAKKLIGISQLRNIEELIEKHSRLYKVLFDLPAGKSALFKTNLAVQLSIHATEVKLGERSFKLVALQNIQPELQKKELEAWQNLTRILRHEIMNSITPISSLTTTMKDILQEEAVKKGDEYRMPSDSVEDLEEGLVTIEDRSKGLIKFINAYRDYTTIPLPDLKPLIVRDLINRVVFLMKSEMKKSKVKYLVKEIPESLSINGDEEQLEQVLINILKNSIEAMNDIASPEVRIFAGTDEENNVFISIEDSGKGIVREALEKIFIPFYTTKSTGSGIGLALSRQIMQQHHGTLNVVSEPDKFTRFTLQF